MRVSKSWKWRVTAPKEEVQMRFLVSWKTTEIRWDAEQARILALFAQWEPPVELSEWAGFVDGDGGFAIAEADKQLLLDCPQLEAADVARQRVV